MVPCCLSRVVSTSSAAFACLLLPTACSLTRESNPPRTATEEFLISTAIDRAVEGLKLDIPKSTSIYLDASDFEGTDSKYAISDVTERVLLAGGRLASDRSKADMVVAIRSGALSTDSDGFLLGIPGNGRAHPAGGNAQPARGRAAEEGRNPGRREVRRHALRCQDRGAQIRLRRELRLLPQDPLGRAAGGLDRG